VTEAVVERQELHNEILDVDNIGSLKDHNGARHLLVQRTDRRRSRPWEMLSPGRIWPSFRQ
jgi:hypothetical protein